MIFYGLKSCDTCKKALKALADAGHTPEVRDVRADGIPAENLHRWLAIHGDALVNKRSTTWRGLDDAERAKAAAPESAAALILSHPTLMKRPVIEADDTVHVGWGPDVQAAVL